MTALYPSALGVTPSDRLFKAIPFPLKLNSNQVVFDWWLKCPDISIENKKDRDTLLLLADAVSSNPRVCQYVKGFINIENNNQVFNTQDFFSRLLKYVVEKTTEMYTPEFPNIKLLHAIMFRQAIDQDDMVLKAVKSSVVINSITDPALNEKNLLQKIYPESSLIMLYASAEKNASASQNAFSIETCFYLTIKTIFEQLSELSKNIGDTLELMTKEWLFLRLVVATKNYAEDLTVRNLFGIDADEAVADATVEHKLNTKIILPSMISKIENKNLSHTTYSKNRINEKSNNASVFVTDMKNMCDLVSIEYPVHILKSAKGDSADLYLILHRKETKPLIIAIEIKSRKIKKSDQVSQQNDVKFFLPNDGKQFYQTKKTIENIPGIDINTDFLYIYFDTNDKYTQCFTLDGALSLSEKNCQLFFGPLFAMYKTCRNNVESK
jgi:hypothetical protein